MHGCAELGRQKKLERTGESAKVKVQTDRQTDRQSRERDWRGVYRYDNEPRHEFGEMPVRSMRNRTLNCERTIIGVFMSVCTFV